MLVRIAELEIDPDRFDDFSALLSEEIEASVRLESGVLFLFALSLKGDRGKVRLMEGYAARRPTRLISKARIFSSTRR